MTAKIRVHDLAKQYGIPGKDLAKKLQDLGFTQVKSHMTALTDFEVMECQGRLEAHGYVTDSQKKKGEDEDEQRLGGLVVRRKKKKATGETVEEEAEHAAPPEPEALAEAELEDPPAPLPAPVHELELLLTEEEPPVVELEALEPPLAPEPMPAPLVAAEPLELLEEPLEPAPETLTEEPLVAELPGLPQTTEELETLSAEPVAEAERAETEVVEGVQVVRPSAQRRAGKVVGFIDLSLIKGAPVPKRPQSRRLRSSDEEAPDVQPTMGHDRRSALQRGAHSNRDQLTAGQLREREAGRFLRRNRPTTTVRRGPGGAQPVRQPGGQGSPFSGQAVSIEEPITVKKLAEALAVKGNQLLQTSFRLLGFGAVTLNSTIDNDTAELIAHEFGIELEVVRAVEAEETLLEGLSKKRGLVEKESLAVRPPTVAFMGHVDHGKTTLIDTIRQSKVTEGESGGITQHIGAYQVTNKHGHTLTVIDTPGHEAFSAMRARGAGAVDVAVLVVAADDGVMPQTEEALNHARAAKVPVVVALNKIDKPDANAERVKQQLSGIGLVAEEWGGNTAMIEVSGLRGTGLEELLERVFLEGEVLELQCHPDGPATGIVLEAQKQEGRGILAHLLVLDGTLNRGDVVLAGDGYGKVRSITNDRGVEVPSAGPSMPVEVSGLSELPAVGEHFHVVADLATAREVAAERAHKNRMVNLAQRSKVRSSDILVAVAEADKKAIDLIIKADVIGTLEALREQIARLVHSEVEVRLIHSAVGNVSESDVNLAAPSKGVILTFHVGITTQARRAAEKADVEIRQFDVIYELLDFVRAAMEGSLAPDIEEQITAHVEIRRIFESSRFGKIAGCQVLDGTIHRDNRVRLMRAGEVIHTGKIGSLRRVNDDAREVREGFECGVVIKDFDAIQEGDVIESFRLVEVKRHLEI